MKILIAEDDNLMRRMLEAALEKWGYNCISAKNGEEAWNYFQAGDFELVITDWIMPGLSGIELCQKIRKSRKDYYTYIIILTSLDNKDLLAYGLDEGADDYVGKPFNPSELRARIKAGQRIMMLERSLAISNIKMKAELKKAATTIENMLPHNKEIFKQQNIAFDWLFRPTAYLGGDFFNVLKLDQHRIAIYSIDVSGHGITAALLVATLSHLLRPLVEHGGLLKKETEHGEANEIVEPDELAARLNRRFPIESEQGTYFTLFYAIIDTKKLSMDWVRAGHPKPIHTSKSGVAFLESGNPPIGIIDGYKFESCTTKLAQGDKIILYSDGMLESQNDLREQFGELRLSRVVEDSRMLSVKQIVKNINATFDTFNEGNAVEDDVTLLALEIL